MNHQEQMRLIHEWPIRELEKRGQRAKGVIHVGAHLGQEFPYYEAAGIHQQIWIEPIPALYEKLEGALPKRESIRTFMVACSNSVGRQKMVISGNLESMTSSLLNLKKQVELYPSQRQVGEIEVAVTKLDLLLEENKINLSDYDLLVVDTQGSELDALKGGIKALAHMKFVVAEVGTIELYEGMPLLSEVDKWMESQGLERVGVLWFGPGRRVEGNEVVHAFGDALYLRK